MGAPKIRRNPANHHRNLSLAIVGGKVKHLVVMVPVAGGPPLGVWADAEQAARDCASEHPGVAAEKFEFLLRV